MELTLSSVSIQYQIIMDRCFAVNTITYFSVTPQVLFLIKPIHVQDKIISGSADRTIMVFDSNTFAKIAVLEVCLQSRMDL